MKKFQMDNKYVTTEIFRTFHQCVYNNLSTLSALLLRDV